MLPLLANTMRANTKEKIKLRSFPSYYISFTKKKTAVGFCYYIYCLFFKNFWMIVSLKKNFNFFNMLLIESAYHRL